MLWKTKSLYRQGKPLSRGVSIGWIAVDTLDVLVVVAASTYRVWPLPLEEQPLRIAGAVLICVGVAVMLAGMLEFRSSKKILGMETSNLVTTGIYRYSRNPQFLGWYLLDTGIALTGPSGYALLIAILTMVFGHYYIVKLEEPYLERVFGEEYLGYKRRTPRYIGLPRGPSSR